MIFNFTYSQLTPRYKWYGANDVEDFNEISRTLVFQSTSDFLGTKSGTKSIQLSLVLLLDSSHTSYLSVSQSVSQLGTVRNGLPANLPEPGLEKPNKAGREVGTRCSVGEGVLGCTQKTLFPKSLHGRWIFVAITVEKRCVKFGQPLASGSGCQFMYRNVWYLDIKRKEK